MIIGFTTVFLWQLQHIQWGLRIACVTSAAVWGSFQRAVCRVVAGALVGTVCILDSTKSLCSGSQLFCVWNPADQTHTSLIMLVIRAWKRNLWLYVLIFSFTVILLKQADRSTINSEILCSTGEVFLQWCWLLLILGNTWIWPPLTHACSWRIPPLFLFALRCYWISIECLEQHKPLSGNKMKSINLDLWP